MRSIRLATQRVVFETFRLSGAAWVHEMLGRLYKQPFASILLFHRVTDQIPEDGLTVSTARFDRICRMLAKRFRVVPLDEMFRLTRRGEQIPPRTVAITFDDSYRDNLFASYVLAGYDLPATFFVPSGYVGTDRAFPWDRHLPRMANLTWEDVREMAGLGFEIGSHTVNHVDMGQATTAQAREELIRSKEVIEQHLGRPVRRFAFPFGREENCPASCLPLIEEAGYKGAVSAHGGRVTAGVDPALLPRIPSYPDTNLLGLDLRGTLDWFRRLSATVREGLVPAQALSQKVRVRNEGSEEESRVLASYRG